MWNDLSLFVVCDNAGTVNIYDLSAVFFSWNNINFNARKNTFLLRVWFLFLWDIVYYYINKGNLVFKKWNQLNHYQLVFLILYMGIIFFICILLTPYRYYSNQTELFPLLTPFITPVLIVNYDINVIRLAHRHCDETAIESSVTSRNLITKSFLFWVSLGQWKKINNNCNILYILYSILHRAA